jgi:hypothetical protein
LELEEDSSLRAGKKEKVVVVVVAAGYDVYRLDTGRI